MNKTLENPLFIPIFDDLLFKEALCHKDNRKQLIKLLELTTGLSKNVIENHLVVRYESVLEKLRLGEKAMRGDIIIEFDQYKVNLECYSYFDNASFEKTTSYIMRIFSSQLEKGEDYKELESVIQINFIDNLEIPFDESVISNYYITNGKDLEDKKIIDKFMIKYYRIDKARKIPYTRLSEEMRWIRFIGATSAEERNRIAEGDELLMELNNWIDKYVKDEKTKEYYGKWAEQIALDKGKKIGKKEGIKEGTKESIEQIAKNMLKKGYDIQDIIEITGISEEQINSLKNE